MNEIEKVRILIAEMDSANQIFTDDQIQGFLEIHDGNIHRAAASALRAIAIDEALLRDIKTDDISVTSSATSRELRTIADKLDDRADKIEKSQGNEYFDMVYPIAALHRPAELTYPTTWLRGL